ncbi:hypothetical protein M1M11_08185 [Pseudomonas azerbaijanoccidens]|uniref:hypothetical protein n=1 Tax=Pseudomonas azerbaijanoccidentalis TaxID=2842347 RepID=UPI00200B0338|nr:hypothetical protein [Pseudomonas azerbaijanoccidentalis]MCK8664861.1 hypothetical protein [Pseudomonas azerbaijanoccidentalis]
MQKQKLKTASDKSKLYEYINYQEQQLLKGANSPAHYPTGVISPEDLIFRTRRNLTFEFDKKVSDKMAFILTCVDSGEQEYWAHINLKSYRKHFLRFLINSHSVPIEQIDSTWHVDHIFNKAYARKNDIKYVRMCLIPGEQNMSYGRKLEKNILKKIEGKRPIYLMSYLQILKVFGIAIPKSKEDYENRKDEIGNVLLAKSLSGYSLRPPSFFLDRYFEHYYIL